MNVPPKPSEALKARFCEEDERQLKEDVRAVLDTPAGRRLFMAMIHHGGLFQYTRRDDNHAYISGKRDAVLEVFKVAKSIAPAQCTSAQIDRDYLCQKRDKMLDEARKQ